MQISSQQEDNMKHLVLVTRPCAGTEVIFAASQTDATKIAGNLARKDKFETIRSIAYYVEYPDGQRVHCVWPDHVMNLV